MTVVGVAPREMTLWAGGESDEGNVSSCEVWGKWREEGRERERERGGREGGRGEGGGKRGERGGSDVGELADSTLQC